MEFVAGRRREPADIIREALDRVPDLDHLREVILDRLQRRHHLADALAGEIVEIAGLENLRDLILDVLRHALLVPALERGDERGGGLFDGLGGLEKAVGRVRRAFLDGRELLHDARDLSAIEAMIRQRQHLALGFLDRLVDDVELAPDLARFGGNCAEPSYLAGAPAGAAGSLRVAIIARNERSSAINSAWREACSGLLSAKTSAGISPWIISSMRNFLRCLGINAPNKISRRL